MKKILNTCTRFIKVFSKNKNTGKKALLLSFTILVAVYCWAQGCVAIRNVAGISPDLLFENIQPNDPTQLDKWIPAPIVARTLGEVPPTAGSQT